MEDGDREEGPSRGVREREVSELLNVKSAKYPDSIRVIHSTVINILNYSPKGQGRETTNVLVKSN